MLERHTLSETSQQIIRNFIKEHLGENKLSFNKNSYWNNHASFIISAAERRGLKSIEVAPKEFIFFDGKDPVGGISKMVTSLVSFQAVRVGASKPLSKRLFASAGIPVPKGRIFKRNADQDALEFFSQIDTQVVVKPSAGKSGNGITTGISNIKQFERGWTKAKKESTTTSSILVEQHVSGLDIRAMVVGERVIAAATRLPAFVQGNGRDSVEELTNTEIVKRSTNAYLKRMPLNIDYDWLHKQGIRINDVPSDGSIIFLNGTANLHQGGEQVDITNIIAPELKEIAVAAAQSVPGMTVAGIDMLVKSVSTATDAVVLEANTSANINVHHLPAYGKPVDVGGAIVDELIRQSPRGRIAYY